MNVHFTNLLLKKSVYECTSKKLPNYKNNSTLTYQNIKYRESLKLENTFSKKFSTKLKKHLFFLKSISTRPYQKKSIYAVFF